MDAGQQRADAQYSVNLDRTLQELQVKVREHELELQKLRSYEYDLPQSAAGQARVISAALTEVTDSEPFLPFPESLLPALLALRKTHQTIQESNDYLTSQRATHGQLLRRLEADQTQLKDQFLLKDALEARIRSLRDELDANVHTTPEEGARERLEELKQKKKNYDRETSSIMKILLEFIDERLAPMLAAEELGGPVVGDLMNIDGEDLAAGFNAQGKLKKAKEDATKDDKRQRRIDEIWGQAGGENSAEEQNEVTAAGKEMRQLTEELLNQLADANGDNSAAYVQLPRESAAARFLVRSKVAQFHPKDATRIRLFDFGRELEA